MTDNKSFNETTSDFTFDNTAKQRQIKLYKVACWFVQLFVWIWILFLYYSSKGAHADTCVLYLK